MVASHVQVTAETIMARCDQLADCTEEPGRITRRFATPALHQVGTLVAEWMRAAGMGMREDNAGNVIGRYEAARPGARTLLLGSHLDSVRDAGRYDGPLGVMVALALVERLHARGEQLPFAIEVLGFADEEGLRFHTAYLGSSAFAGNLPADAHALRDPDGITLAEAIRAYGGDPDQLNADARDTHDLLGYCEVHIEQGPVLEARGVPVGVVTAIAGQTRCDATFVGMAGHAGTVPMNLRRDALCAASDFVLAAEAYARQAPGLVATVGQMRVEPGASNVIPGEVTLSLDVRHQEDTHRNDACTALRLQAEAVADARDVQCRWEMLQENPAVSCSPPLVEMLTQAVALEGHELIALPSGAGHDGVSMRRLTQIAMLFVRCKGGISHNPAESVTVEDVATAIEVMERFLALLAEAEATR